MVKVRHTFTPGRSKNLKNIRKQKQKFPKLMYDVVRTSDIILEVLDARFVDETRNEEVEKLIKKEGKKIIYVLNKIDLVDKKLKLEEIHTKKLFPYCFISCRERTGQTKLRTKIKIAVKRLDIKEKDKKRAQIGIIGYPNTGKSSLINLLAGGASAKTGSSAGFTKGIQKIRLTSDILLLDTPGVIPVKEYSHSLKEAIERHTKIGARTSEKIRDPEMVVFSLMKTNSSEIEKFYNINVNGDAEKLIENIGRKKNFLKKGGKINEDRTSREIIKDWQSGKIRT